MGSVGIGEVLDAKIVDTEANLGWASVMHPQSCGIGARVVPMRGELSNEVLISKNGGLLEAIHAFLDFDVHIAIVINDVIELVLFADSSGEIFVFIMRMYSGSFMGGARKWSLRSVHINLAPLWASEMVLLMISFASRREAAGEPASSP
jgi:hypothetical protein